MRLSPMRNKVLVFDLDDTLYKEIDFLKSAFHEIANRISVSIDPQTVFDEMMHTYYKHENVFQLIINKYCPLETIGHLLEIYRNHHPDISLPIETEKVLEQLSQKATLGMITDGRAITQRNKIKALRLDRYFKDDNILISEETGFVKPSEEPYFFFMNKYPSSDYCYIGDNTEKDFVAANSLGWETICLKDNGNNIHKQVFSLPSSYLPHHIIDDFTQLKEKH